MRLPTPGIVISRVAASAKGGINRSTSASRRVDRGDELVDVVAGACRSIRAWWSSKRPTSASRSSGILGRIRVKRHVGEHLGVAFAGDQRFEHPPAATPSMSVTTESSLIPASSSTFWIRWVSRARSSTSFLR